MPRIKKSIKGIEILTDAEKKIIDEYIKSKPEIQRTAQALKNTFKKHFCFGEDEIKLYIYNICKDLEDEAVYKINEICSAFEMNDVVNFDIDERTKLARGVFDDIISLYRDESRRISDTFVEVLEKAKQKRIDPFKLAIKTNIESLSSEDFGKAIDTLTKHKYYDKNSKETELLFSDIEFKAAVEQCATIANASSSDAIQQVLNLLYGLFWDEASQKYTFDVHEIIKSVPSLLLVPPAQLELTIDMLNTFYINSPNDRIKLLKRIKASPSILAVNFNKISKFNSKFKEVVEEVIKTKGYKNLSPKQKDTSKYAQTIADEFVFDINRLTQIDKLKTENIKANAQILAKYLGQDNAVTCMQNVIVLQTKPEFLECMLASIVKEEQLTNTNLRQFFVENSYRALTKAETSSTSQAKAISEEDEGEFARAKKEIVIEEFPEIFISNDEMERIKKRAGNKISGISQVQFERMKKLALLEEEKRKQKEQEEIKRKQEMYAEKKRQKAEKKKISRRDRNKSFGAIVTPSSTVNFTEEKVTETKELSLEELREIRRNNIPKMPTLPDNLSPFEAYVAIYEPVVDAMAANKHFPEQLPKFKKIKEFTQIYETALKEGCEIVEKLKDYSKTLQKLILDEDGYIKHNAIISLLAEKDEKGVSGLKRINSLGKKLLELTIANGKKIDSAFYALKDSYKKNEKAETVFTRKIDTKNNSYAKYDDAKQALYDYSIALEDEAEDFFGIEFDKIFITPDKSIYKQPIHTYFEDSSLSPNCCTSLIYDLFVSGLHDAIVDEFLENNVIRKAGDIQGASTSKNPFVFGIEVKQHEFVQNLTIDRKNCPLDADEVIEFVNIVKSGNDMLNKREDHLAVKYNKGTGNLIIYYSQQGEEEECSYAVVKKDDEVNNPGLTPMVISHETIKCPQFFVTDQNREDEVDSDD